jgi:UDP-glucose 4-epimerase
MSVAGRVVVTGGAGAVGSTIVDHLVRAGAADEIVVLDTLTRGRLDNLAWAMANGPVRVESVDITDRDRVAHALDGTELVFHQAALRVTQCAEEPRLAHEVMVDGTFHLVDAARLAGVGKIVMASSAIVYGATDVVPTPEHHSVHGSRTMYGAAKIYNELLLRSYYEMHGLDYVVLRYFNVYGRRMAIRGPHTEVLVRWMEAIEDGRPPRIDGDGAGTMDFVHIDDVARANLLAASSSVTDAVINVGSGREVSLRQLADLLLSAMGSELEPVHGPARAVNSVARRAADTTAAKALLGFEATIPLEAGLRDLVDWWRAAREMEEPA